MFDFLNPQVPEIEAKDLLKKLKEEKDYVLLDVRTPEEYFRRKIKGSINLPVDKIGEIEKVIPDKEKTIYVYCLSGSRSSVALNTMINLNYTNAFSLKSGLLAWRANNFPLEN